MDETKPEQKAPVVVVDKKGLLEFSNHLELASAASIVMQTKLAPPHLINEGREAVMSALMFCKQFNLPQKAMGQMAYVKGRLTCFGSLFTAICERHKNYGSKREYFLDPDQNEISVKNKNLTAPIWAAVVEIKKKGDEHWTQYWFSMDDAKQAGLCEPRKRNGEIIKDSPWIKYTRDMLAHKARKRALSNEYASALEGVEYHEDVQEAYEMKERDVTPADNLKDVKNDFGESDEPFEPIFAKPEVEE
jgi:hypothetical protein